MLSVTVPMAILSPKEKPRGSRLGTFLALPDSAAEAVDAPAADMADDAEMGDSETAAEPWRPRNHRNEPRGPDYRPFTSKFDEIVGAEDLCEAEELDRLRAHIAQAGELLVKGEGVGRQLDFLCQELNREANTLCSKANDLELTNIGLELKATVEQFREQVQNVE